MRVALLAAFPFHIIPGFEAHVPRGHYATWLPQLSAAWVDEPGLELHWITVTRKAIQREPVRWRGQTFHFIAVPEKLRALRGYRRDSRLIAGKLDELQPDLVHAWGTEDCYGLAAIRSGREFLLSMQGILSEYVRRTRMHPLVHLQAAMERWILAKARHLSAESNWGCDLLRRRAPHATVYQVEYGVQDLFFDVEWRPDPKAPVAIFVGTPDSRKGPQDAVAAFAMSALRDAELWIVGDRGSSFASRLERHSTANVRWLGRRSTAETASLMAQAWCLVLPTRADTSPNVVKEARVIGLPVVTTPHGGQTDYIVDGETGWLVEPGDVITLAARLEKLLGSFRETRRLGECRHQEHRAWFRPRNTAANFLRVYRAILDASAGLRLDQKGPMQDSV